ncbi:hypothetical protein SGRIM128S_03765 [Streptomyces griseomycini]
MVPSPPVSARFSEPPAALGRLAVSPSEASAAVSSCAAAGSAVVSGSSSPCPWFSMVDFSAPASICSSVGAEAAGAGAAPAVSSPGVSPSPASPPSPAPSPPTAAPPLPPPNVTSEQE